MGIDVAFAAIRMIVAAVDVADSSIGHLQAGDHLPKQEQETHWPTALVAGWIVRVLDQHGLSPNVSDVRSVQIVAIEMWTENLGKNARTVLRVGPEKLGDRWNQFAEPLG